MAIGQLSQDTDTTGHGETMPPLPVPAGDGPRPQPTDAPGSPGGGWAKVDAEAVSGWSAIDDAGDDGAPVWRQT